MNRELKFKAIAKINGYWNKVNSDEFSNLSQFFAEVLEMEKGGDEVFVMQYTGLKDRNKKEVYEGYIVKGQMVVGLEDDKDNEDCISPSPAQIFEEKVGEVIWHEHMLTYKLKEKNANLNLSIFFPNLYEIEDLEIIGNIYEGVLPKYENPELLKD